MPEGDGLPSVTVSPSRGKRIKLKPAYSQETARSVVDNKFEEAARYKFKIRVDTDRAFNLMKGLKLIFVMILSFSGATLGFVWTQNNTFADSEIGNMMLAASAIGLLALGPWYAWALSGHLSKGIYRGVSKYIAISMIAVIFLEEVMIMVGSRSEAFGDVLMIWIIPYTTVYILSAAVAILYLRHDVKMKRDLMHLKEKEEKIVAKNATDDRFSKAKRQIRDRNLGKMAETLSHWRVTFFNIGISIVKGFVRDYQAANELYQIQGKRQKTVLKNKRTATKK